MKIELVMSDKTGRVLIDAADELVRASEKHPALHSAHEGFAVLLEEVDELKAEVWKNPRKVYGDDPAGPEKHKAAMRAEAVQVAAMALRFMVDVC